MKCPTCKKEMLIKKTYTTNNEAKSKIAYKEYKRVIYWCSEDDIWVSIETPIKKTS